MSIVLARTNCLFVLSDNMSKYFVLATSCSWYFYIMEVKNRNARERGFAHIIALILFVLLAAGVIGAYRVYVRHTQAKNLSVATPTVLPDPVQAATAGWKEYCNEYEKACLKIPPQWTESAISESEHWAESPSGKIRLMFQAPVNPDYFKQVQSANTSCVLSIKLTQSLKGVPTLKAVQSKDAPSTHSPSIFLTRSLALPPDGSAGVGICTADAMISRYHSDTSIRLSVIPVGSEYITASAAKKSAWFDLEEVKTAWLMMQTFEYQ